MVFRMVILSAKAPADGVRTNVQIKIKATADGIRDVDQNNNKAPTRYSAAITGTIFFGEYMLEIPSDENECSENRTITPIDLFLVREMCAETITDGVRSHHISTAGVE